MVGLCCAFLNGKNFQTDKPRFCSPGFLTLKYHREEVPVEPKSSILNRKKEKYDFFSNFSSFFDFPDIYNDIPYRLSFTGEECARFAEQQFLIHQTYRNHPCMRHAFGLFGQSVGSGSDYNCAAVYL